MELHFKEIYEPPRVLIGLPAIWSLVRYLEFTVAWERLTDSRLSNIRFVLDKLDKAIWKML